MTVRQVFYQATVRGIVEKTEAGYAKVQTDLVVMRKAGDLPYGWLADNTRWQRRPRTYDGIEDALEETARLYRKSLWNDADSYVEIDFQGFSIAAGSTLTIRSGAPGQTAFLWNTDANPTTIDGALRAEGNQGAPPPKLLFANQNGVTISGGGSIVAPNGLILSGLGNSWTLGQPVINQGVVDGGPLLDVEGLSIGGGGHFHGDAIVLSTPTRANNPVYGAHFLANGLQLYPSTGTDVSLTLHAYGSAPQVLNVIIYGNGFVWMYSTLFRPIFLRCAPTAERAAWCLV